MSPAIPPVTSVSPQHADPKAADSAARETGARHRWHWPLALLRHGAAIALLAAVLRYFLIPEIRQAHLSQLAHISVPWLIAGTLLEGISLFCYSLLTRCLLPAAGPRLLTVLRIDMSCTALDHVVPRGRRPAPRLDTGFFPAAASSPGKSAS
jgi:uncharacterized membrane protein YbhN (UPF0104 family)